MKLPQTTTLKGIALVFLSSLSLTSIRPAWGQFSVSPMVSTPEIKQGMASGVITVRNITNEPQQIRLNAQPFTYTRSGFSTRVNASSNPTSQTKDPWDLSDYMIFSPAELILAPREVRRIRFLATILPSMPQGEYRSVIFVSPVKPTVASGVRVTASIGATIYVRNGKTFVKPEVEQADYNPEGRVINLLVQNNGTQSVVPQVEWQLRQGGKTIKSGIGGDYTVIAQGERNVPINFIEPTDSFSAGDYHLTGRLLWGDDPGDPETLSFDVPVKLPEVSPVPPKKESTK